MSCTLLFGPSSPRRCPSLACAAWREEGRSQLGGLRQRRAPLVVVIFDLAIEALKALGCDDPPGFLNRPHRARPLAQMAGIAALGTALEQIEEVQPVQEGQHSAQRTQ